MADTWVLVFPGQGAQTVGMGQDIADALPEVRALFARADDVLGCPLTKTIFEGPDAALVDTAIQQPALVLVGLAVKKALELKLGRPLGCSAAAGLSLGEYAALAAVDALSADEALRLVRRRGELMQQASARVPSGMAAVFHLDAERIRAACEQAAKETGGVVSASNFNGGGQIVIGGTLDALARAGELCKAAGAKRVMKLLVSGAFHTALMQPAADAFGPVVDAANIQRATQPVYANCTAARVQDAPEIRDALKRQLTHPVLWEQTVKNLVSTGRRQFLELG
ncbi:MAG: ACP S-malonyltransferase, partial [Planctomycetota bacterium]|nr:ACP S-malonyltransferase [Planctomycetota bacterium]